MESGQRATTDGVSGLVVELKFLGVFLAKTLQDNRLVDLPLSNPLLKLICQGTCKIVSILIEK